MHSAEPPHRDSQQPASSASLAVGASESADREARGSPEDSAATLAARSRITLLVVDDAPAARYALARGLRKLGFEVLEAGNGRQALRLAPLCAAVLLDVQLPDLPGTEVCRRLRQSPRTSKLPVLHVSSLAPHEHAPDVGSFDAADGYFVRPVDVVVVASLIEELLRKRSEGH